MSKNARLFQWQRITTNKRLFDPASKADKQEFAFFLKNMRWSSIVCPFELEWPHLTVPDMIKDKICRHLLKVEEE